MKRTLVIPDKCIFDIWIDNRFDLNILEDLEKKLGPLVIDRSVYTSVLDDVDVKVTQYLARDLWNRTLGRFYENYYKTLDVISKRNNLTKEALELGMSEYHKRFMEITRSFNAGISNEDVRMIVIAYLAHHYANYAPVVVSDDSDILVHGQMIASYFGISYGFLSVFELLRLTNAPGVIMDYMANRQLGDVPLQDLDGTYRKETCYDGMQKLTEKCLISFHPHSQSSRDFRRITKIDSR